MPSKILGKISFPIYSTVKFYTSGENVCSTVKFGVKERTYAMQLILSYTIAFERSGVTVKL